MTHTTQGAPQSIWLRWLGLSALVIVLDQASKLAVDHSLAYSERVNVLPVFDLIRVYNHGAAFSFLASEPGWQRWFFTLLGLVASAIIIWLLRRADGSAKQGLEQDSNQDAHNKNADKTPAQRPRGRSRFKLALALILGGALGNVIDRLAYGHVIDFLLFYWHDWYYPAFNLADGAITCGAVLLVIDELLRGRAKT